MNEITMKAAAKINLCLHVLGRRADGYHELAMAMQRVSLYDEIGLRLSRHSGVEVCCPGLPLAAGEENITARAARLLLQQVGSTAGVVIEIDKKIPVAAGLGGGSSDAAAVLIGLNRLLSAGLSRAELCRLGATLGADVPFFIFERPAWATGIGTELQPLPVLPEFACLLIHPGFAVSTAAVYQSLRLTKGGELASLPRFSVATREQLAAALHNDLEAVTLRLHPEIETIKQSLLDCGALGALMSGSGATVFGLFPDLSAARRARQLLLQQQGHWFVEAVEPI